MARITREDGSTWTADTIVKPATPPPDPPDQAPLPPQPQLRHNMGPPVAIPNRHIAPAVDFNQAPAAPTPPMRPQPPGLVEGDPLAGMPPPPRDPLRPIPGAAVRRQEQISWAPIGDPKFVPFNGSSYLAVRKALVETFGAFPIQLRSEHLPILRAMANAAGEGGHAYTMLHAALLNLPGIELRDL